MKSSRCTWRGGIHPANGSGSCRSNDSEHNANVLFGGDVCLKFTQDWTANDNI